MRTSIKCLSFYNTRLASLDYYQRAQTLEIYNCLESFLKNVLSGNLILSRTSSYQVIKPDGELNCVEI